MTFSASEPAELFFSHVEDHVVKVCPVCTQEFKPEDDAFEAHVNMCVTSNEQQQQQQQQELLQEQQQQEQPQEQQEEPQMLLSHAGEFV